MVNTFRLTYNKGMVWRNFKHFGFYELLHSDKPRGQLSRGEQSESSRLIKGERKCAENSQAVRESKKLIFGAAVNW